MDRYESRTMKRSSLLPRLIVVVVLTLLMPFSAKAQEKIDVETAQALAKTGDVLLLDIRTPREWKQTGVSPLATTLNMRESSFGSKLMGLIENNRDRPIALICATGGRSGYLAQVMAEAGFSNVYDVSEGMMGSKAGPGWIGTGLPVVAFDPNR